jgi:hypothetical protein
LTDNSSLRKATSERKHTPIHTLSGIKITASSVRAMPKVRRARTVQDGHSAGEQCLFAALWHEARKTENLEYRLITMGWNRMGRLANLKPQNVRLACGRLIAKLAVEMVVGEDSAKHTGRTYRVYSYPNVVERRIAAGMEWYVKTRGVKFVRPGAGFPAECARWDAHHATLSEKGTAPEKGTDAVPFSVGSTVPFSGRASLKQLKSIEDCDPPSSSIVAALARETGFDDDVCRKIVRLTLAVAPDFTERHILRIVEYKLRQLKGGIRNVPGFLAAAIPNAAAGELGKAVRIEVAREVERQRRVEAWTILDNPESSEESKAEARRIIGSEAQDGS